VAVYNIVTHPVKDFNIWKAVFDRMETVRKEGGELSVVVLRHCDDSNMVTVINTWDTAERAQAFFANKDLQSAMAESGVTAPPTFVLACTEPC
jgi:quinol monooxygenase YgiN